MANKFPKFLAISLLAAFGIVACDDVEARPNTNGIGDDVEVISFKDINVYGNNFKSVNDKIHDDLATETLHNILDVYAVSMAAPFNRNAAKIYAKKIEVNGEAVDADSLLTLEDVANDQSKVATFVSQYKIYEVLNEDGSHNTAKEFEYIKARYDAILKAINKKLFSMVKSSAENHKFDEQKFLVSLYVGGGKVQNPFHLTDGSYYKDLVLLPEIEEDDLFEKVLHKSFYSSDANTYIEDSILPDIYTNILTEQYILEKQDNLLGSSYARKINYVAIPYGDINNQLFAEQLVKKFVTDYLLTSKTTDVNEAFKLLSRAWNGAFMGEDDPTSTDEWNLLKDLGFVDTLSVGDHIKQAPKSGIYYIDGSAYGKLVEDYDLYDVNPDKSINAEDYTGSNSYVKEIGFEAAEIDVAMQDFTGNGWFIKSNDTTNLSSNVKDRLYNLLVATGINNGTSSVLSVDDSGKWSDTETNKFVTKFVDDSGKVSYFLRTDSRKVNEEAYSDIIFLDTSNSTYYIVNVEEAVSPNYMKDCDDYATKLAVLDLLSASDSYVGLATRYWLEKCDIQYHDQSVYDYFESNYPELFEED